MALVSTILLLGATVAQPPVEPPFGKEWRQRALDMAQEWGMFGPLDFSDDTVMGAFMEAEIKGNGSLESFNLVRANTSVEVFTSVSVSGAPGEGEWTLPMEGSPAIEFQGLGVRVGIHNNPTRALIYESQLAVLEITYMPAPGVYIALQTETSVLVVGTGFRGQVSVSGSGSLQVGPGFLKATLPNGALASFRAHSEEGEGVVGSWGQDTVFDAISRDRLGGELFLVALEGGIMEDAVRYSDLTMVSGFDDEGRVEVTLSSEGPGRIVVINIHREVLDLPDVDRLSVELDGGPVERRDNADELTSSISAQAAYYVAAGPNGLFFLFYIPRFSTRTITIGELVEALFRDVSVTEFAYIFLGVAFTAVAAVVLIRRGRRSW